MRHLPTRLWSWLRHLHVEHKGLKLLAIAIALALFALSRQPVSDVRIYGVPVEFINLRPGVEVTSEAVQTVNVRVRGPRDIVRSLTPNQLSVTADLSNKEPGERIIQLRPQDVEHPDGTRVLQIEPASIRLLLEPKQRKRVPVEAQFMGQPGDGLEIHRVNVEPATVEIEGPQAQLDKVHRLLTETISLNGHTSDFRTVVEVETPYRSLNVLTPGPISLAIEIGERRTTRRFVGVPVNALDQPADGRLLTKTVTVELYGARSVLDALRTQDLSAEVRLADLAADKDTAPVQVRLPDWASERATIKSVTPAMARVKQQATRGL
jgi:YbbR domain-containing protein